MSKPAPRDTQRVMSLVDAWEHRFEHPVVSPMRTLPKKQLHAIVPILASLDDAEAIMVIDSMDAMDPDSLKSYHSLQNMYQRFLVRCMERWAGQVTMLEHVEFYARMAPPHVALFGPNIVETAYGDGMSKVLQRFTDERVVIKRKPVAFTDQQIDQMIGTMMQFHDGEQCIADEDIEWFGAHWREIAPFWVTLVRDGDMERARVEKMIEHKRSGLSSGMLDGIL